jgi:hypothetical protein
VYVGRLDLDTKLLLSRNSPTCALAIFYDESGTAEQYGKGGLLHK